MERRPVAALGLEDWYPDPTRDQDEFGKQGNQREGEGESTSLASEVNASTFSDERLTGTKRVQGSRPSKETPDEEYSSSETFAFSHLEKKVSSAKARREGVKRGRRSVELTAPCQRRPEPSSRVGRYVEATAVL